LRQPGFGWGLGVGAITVVLVVTSAALVAWFRMMRIEEELSRPTTTAKAVKAVDASGTWFKIRPDGTGVLEGWAQGSHGYGGQTGTKYSFTILSIGSIDGIAVEQSVEMGADAKTRFFVGTKPFSLSGSAKTGADAVFNAPDPMEEESPFFGREGKLTVEFRRKGDALVATEVTLDPRGEPAPPTGY
jgi:hypothetical protein